MILDVPRCSLWSSFFLTVPVCPGCHPTQQRQTVQYQQSFCWKFHFQDAIFCQKAFMAQLWWWMEVCNKLFENCAKEKHIKEKHIKRLQNRFTSPPKYSLLHQSLCWFTQRSMNIKCKTFDIIQLGMLCYFQGLSIRNGSFCTFVHNMQCLA